MLSEEVIAELSKRLEISPGEAREHVGRVADELTTQLTNGKGLRVPGLGTFTTKSRDQTRSYLPFLRCFALLPPRVRVAFKPSQRLRALGRAFRW